MTREYYRTSPYVTPNSVGMLSGTRFNQNANIQYRMPTDIFDQIKEDPVRLGNVAQNFIQRHYEEQLPRLVTLERYYNGDNDIHYWASNKSLKRADNRISSGFPHYITSIKVGYRLGNPIKFTFNNKDGDNQTDVDNFKQSVDDFNSKNDESYHEKVMGKNLSVTGRAYELAYVRENSNNVALKALDPVNAFVIYDDTIEHHSLFGVYYYMIEYDNKQSWYVTVYTDDKIYYYQALTSLQEEMTLDHDEQHYFGAVPLTEYVNNDERMGDWEAKLDTIDAYDKALSEMANSEEDFSNAILKIVGDVDTGQDQQVDEHGQPMYDENGQPVMAQSDHPNVDRLASILWLKPNVTNTANGGTTVENGDASYLTKELNSQGWKTYLDELKEKINTDTNTPDITDSSFSGNSSGEALSYKLWGNDQENSNQESLYTRGLMRRLRLLSNYWNTTGLVRTKVNNDPDDDLVERFQPIYTPNLPKNDSNIISNIQGLNATGKFSDQTIREMAEPITGVKAEVEQQRTDNEDKEETEKDPIQKTFAPNPNVMSQMKQPLDNPNQVDPNKIESKDPKQLLNQLQNSQKESDK